MYFTQYMGNSTSNKRSASKDVPLKTDGRGNLEKIQTFLISIRNPPLRNSQKRSRKFTLESLSVCSVRLICSCLKMSFSTHTWRKCVWNCLDTVLYFCPRYQFLPNVWPMLGFFQTEEFSDSVCEWFGLENPRTDYWTSAHDQR